MSICSNNGSIFGSNNNNQYIKTNKGDFIAIKGANIHERQILSDLRIPYKQILKSRIHLKAGQVNYLMNHLGLGDNATFVSIHARYNKKSILEEDNYLVWNFYSDFNKQYAMDELLVLTGNSTNRIEQIYLTNPNPDCTVELEVMVAVIDDEYSFFNDSNEQVGRSYIGLDLIDIKTHVPGESIVIYDKSSPNKALAYFTISNISVVSRTVQILKINDSVLGDIFLEFSTEENAIQAESLFNHIINNPSVDLNNLCPLEDLEPPVIYFNQNYENTGDFITFNGLTATSYNTLDGSTFSTQIEFATYATSSVITKTDLLDGLIDSVVDNRDGTMSLSENSININSGTNSFDTITATSSYDITFNIEDIAKNNLNDISISISVY
jgi:hypothetical protein